MFVPIPFNRSMARKLQIVLWHIPGKIEKVEAVVVYTAAQIKHRITIKTLIAWMQQLLDTSVVRPTAISSLKDSQKAAVIQIIWISPYDQLDSTGRIASLPEHAGTDDLSLQFLTASEDGTVAFWNLKLNEKLVFFRPSLFFLIRCFEPENQTVAIISYKTNFIRFEMADVQEEGTKPERERKSEKTRGLDKVRVSLQNIGPRFQALLHPAGPTSERKSKRRDNHRHRLRTPVSEKTSRRWSTVAGRNRSKIFRKYRRKTGLRDATEDTRRYCRR